ncbi:MAG: hypothetical protein V5789_11495 [Colwellia sp.]
MVFKSYSVYIFSLIVAIASALWQINNNLINLTVINRDDAILINDSSIKRVDYLTAVTMMKEEKSFAMRAIDYQLIVDRLTEEELLFQYGLAQGYIYRAEISKVIVSNMLDTIAINHTSKQYSDEELMSIFQDKILKNQDESLISTEYSFENIKIELAQALGQIERSKAVQAYIDWLRQRSDIVIAEDFKNSEQSTMSTSKGSGSGL